ncbi:hypothetical protein HK098_007087 [Nowakowskiella sp. JEL0407]|nr:hypothetical protein HK098_007087 [Nowakowskiella sp. JEL0407]
MPSPDNYDSDGDTVAIQSGIIVDDDQLFSEFLAAGSTSAFGSEDEGEKSYSRYDDNEDEFRGRLRESNVHHKEISYEGILNEIDSALKSDGGFQSSGTDDASTGLVYNKSIVRLDELINDVDSLSLNNLNENGAGSHAFDAFLDSIDTELNKSSLETKSPETNETPTVKTLSDWKRSLKQKKEETVELKNQQREEWENLQKVKKEEQERKKAEKEQLKALDEEKKALEKERKELQKLKRSESGRSTDKGVNLQEVKDNLVFKKELFFKNEADDLAEDSIDPLELQIDAVTSDEEAPEEELENDLSQFDISTPDMNSTKDESETKAVVGGSGSQATVWGAISSLTGRVGSRLISQSDAKEVDPESEKTPTSASFVWSKMSSLSFTTSSGNDKSTDSNNEIAEAEKANGETCQSPVSETPPTIESARPTIWGRFSTLPLPRSANKDYFGSNSLDSNNQTSSEQSTLSTTTSITATASSLWNSLPSIPPITSNITNNASSTTPTLTDAEKPLPAPPVSSTIRSKIFGSWRSTTFTKEEQQNDPPSATDSKISMDSEIPSIEGKESEPNVVVGEEVIDEDEEERIFDNLMRDLDSRIISDMVSQKGWKQCPVADCNYIHRKLYLPHNTQMQTSNWTFPSLLSTSAPASKPIDATSLQYPLLVVCKKCLTAICFKCGQILVKGDIVNAIVEFNVELEKSQAKKSTWGSIAMMEGRKKDDTFKLIREMDEVRVACFAHYDEADVACG